MNSHRISLNYIIRLFTILLLAVLTIVNVSKGADQTTRSPAEPIEPISLEKKELKPPAITILNLIIYSNRLSKELIDMHSQLADIPSYDKVRDDLAGIEDAVESLNWDAMMQQVDSNFSYKRLANTMALLNLQQDYLNVHAKRLNVVIELLSKQKNHWLTEQMTLKIWIETLRNAESFSLVEDNCLELEESIGKAADEVQENMRDALFLLNNVSAMQVTLYTMKVEISQRIAQLRKQAGEQTSPSVFSSKFYSRINSNLFSQAWENSLVQLHKEVLLVRENSKNLILILAFPILLSLVFIKNKKILRRQSNFSMLADRPIAFAVFTSLTFLLPWLTTSMPQLVPVCSITYILSVMRLVGNDEKKVFGITWSFYFFSLQLILNNIVAIMNFPMSLQRIFLLAGSGGWLVYVLWRILILDAQKHRYQWWLLLVIIPALAAILFAGMFGYDEIANYLFRIVFLTVFLFIASIMLFKAINILLEVLLLLLPVVQRHSKVIIQALRPLVFTLCVLVFYSLTALIWLISPASRDSLSILFAAAIPLGSYTLTMKAIFSIAAICYVTIMFSRGVQTILADDVLPGYKIQQGVQLSITRLVHYAILIIGGLTLLYALGVSLTHLTILGGALGVGIGFGLQAIVNNFASGLILLFERPIKVGDTIERGDNFGRVKKLGLRSTIIQTFDNAEIVIPNSDLISGEVTNWTLAERRARMKLPVGVAYGSDIEKVLKVLLTVANEHPMILTTPPPIGLFLAFGNSSLDFELRAWVADFDDRRQVQSELNQEINSEFADAGIEIPFPQSDLHIRTVDDEAANALHMPEITA